MQKGQLGSRAVKLKSMTAFVITKERAHFIFQTQTNHQKMKWITQTITVNDAPSVRGEKSLPVDKNYIDPVGEASHTYCEENNLGSQDKLGEGLDERNGQKSPLSLSAQSL